MKFIFSNQLIFWLTIVIVTMAMIIFKTISLPQTPKLTSHEEQSLSKTEDSYVVDLNKIESAKTEEDFIVKDIEELSYAKKSDAIISLDNLYTLLYGFVVSILFVYREKQNRSKIFQLEKVEDELNIQLAKQTTTIYKDIGNELAKYAEIIKHDINLEALNERIEKEPKYVVIASKNVLEQIISKMYQKYLNLENTNLNIMLTDLYKNRKLNHETNNYAHIIKAFGNKANHTSKIFDSREAILSISNLIEFLKELEQKNILKEVYGV